MSRSASERVLAGEAPAGHRPSVTSIWGCMAKSVGQNGAFQQQAGESVTRGDRRRRELEARSSSPPLACLLLEC